MAAFASSSLLAPADLRLPSLSGRFLDSTEKSFVVCRRGSLAVRPIRSRRCQSQVVVRAAVGGDSGRSGSASIFVSGFVLGGLIVGALGCIYAPQISKALAGADRKDLMRKLPKFIYDEEKALERTRKILAEKIEQLNSAIDDVSAQLRADEAPNGTAVAADEIEAAA
ncbi:Death-like domain-containing protein [Dioscorea alata]|uniref:Death-like domain-containing protein n=1 Tax=Dioscorea alata TaxID=55571 RepID=A0ACB7V6Z5_DIOAL|nr:Death-like domain-containing protein [Dioscorea alata]